MFAELFTSGANRAWHRIFCSNLLACTKRELNRHALGLLLCGSTALSGCFSLDQLSNSKDPSALSPQQAHKEWLTQRSAYDAAVDAGDLNGALPLAQKLNQTSQIYFSPAGEYFIDRLTSIRLLSQLYLKLEQYKEAREVLVDNLPAITEAFGSSSVAVAAVEQNLGVIAYEQGELALALRHFEKAKEIHRTLHGNTSKILYEDYLFLARTHLEAQNYRETSLYVGQALGILALHNPRAERPLARLLILQGDVASEMGDLELAQQLVTLGAALLNLPDPAPKSELEELALFSEELFGSRKVSNTVNLEEATFERLAGDLAQVIADNVGLTTTPTSFNQNPTEQLLVKLSALMEQTGNKLLGERRSTEGQSFFNRAQEMQAVADELAFKDRANGAQ